jgi:nucleotide-binding universal stress UspA family protein
MDIHNAIARWESEGGAIPQVHTLHRRFKALTLRRVLVPIDFSPESLKTLRYAKRLGERFRAKLHLVHVITPPLTFLPQQTPLSFTNFSKDLAADASERLGKLADEFSLPKTPKPYSLCSGALADEINTAARVTRAELIAIATRGFTGLKRAFVGSTTESVLRNAPCPVLVVRENVRRSKGPGARKARPALQFRKILVPLDFSEPSRLGLEYALGFAEEFHATVVLFHSVFVSPYLMGNRVTAPQVPMLIESEQKSARTEMENLREAISRKGGMVETKVVLGSPVEEIGKYVRKAGVDLIITSTHGRSGLQRVFIGSTAERIVRYAPCPVLVVPNRSAQKEASKAG